MENDDSLTIKLPRDLRRWLRVQAAVREVSVSALVRELLEAARATTKKGARR
jgi:plasmid stability protein